MSLPDVRIILLFLLILAAWTPSAPAVHADEPGYKGSASCRPCHQEAFEAWRGSHHDQAMMLASESDAILGDFSDARVSIGGVHARFFRQGGAYLVEIRELDGSSQTFEVIHPFGVDPLQQYLVRTEKGRLQALTLAWDSRAAEDGGQRWISLQAEGEVPPGDLLHWSGAAFRWNQMCADCHSTALRKGYRVDTDSYETTYAEIDVGCEACHGPGAAHIRWAEDGEASGSRGLFDKLIGRGAWSPNPAGPQRMSNPHPALASAGGAEDGNTAGVPEIQVCAPCHSRRSVIGDPVAGHGRFLDAHRPELLEDGLYQVDGQILDEVYVYGSFLQSRMFAAGVTCSDCHDPHSLRLRAEGNALCGNCHNAEVFDAPSHHFHPAGSDGAQCVSCHMPERTYMSVDGRRDHSFQVPRPELAHELGTSLACLDCHTERDAQWADSELAARNKRPRGGKNFPRAFAASRSGNPRAASLLEDVIAQPAESGIARATAALMLRSHPGAVSQRALARAVADGDPLVRLGAASALDSLPPTERWRLGRSLLSDDRRAVRIEAGRALADVPPRDLTGAEKSALQNALAEYARAQTMQADWPQSHVNLGVLAARQGKLDQAQQHYEQAIRVGPDFIPAYVNLADTLRLRQQEQDAFRVLKQGLARAPDDAGLRHALGLSLVRQGKSDLALPELRRAALRAPDHVRYVYVYAVALHSAGSTNEARAVVHEGLLRHPADSMLLPLALSFSLQQSDRASALAYARQLSALDPQNAEVAQLLRRLEQ